MNTKTIFATLALLGSGPLVAGCDGGGDKPANEVEGAEHKHKSHEAKPKAKKDGEVPAKADHDKAKKGEMACGEGGCGAGGCGAKKDNKPEAKKEDKT